MKNLKITIINTAKKIATITGAQILGANHEKSIELKYHKVNLEMDDLNVYDKVVESIQVIAPTNTRDNLHSIEDMEIARNHKEICPNEDERENRNALFLSLAEGTKLSDIKIKLQKEASCTFKFNFA